MEDMTDSAGSIYERERERERINAQRGRKPEGKRPLGRHTRHRVNVKFFLCLIKHYAMKM
jgi:hypothetical protein